MEEDFSKVLAVLRQIVFYGLKNRGILMYFLVGFLESFEREQDLALLVQSVAVKISNVIGGWLKVTH
jgi:hypothetical protein